MPSKVNEKSPCVSQPNSYPILLLPYSSKSVFLNLFWLAAHLASKNNLAAHLSVKLDQNYENSTVFTYFKVFQDLAAHLKRFHGTLVCRGTPVEKHCPCVMAKIYTYN